MPTKPYLINLLELDAWRAGVDHGRCNRNKRGSIQLNQILNSLACFLHDWANPRIGAQFRNCGFANLFLDCGFQ